MKPELMTFAANAQFVATLVEQGVRVLVIGGVAVRHHVPSRDADDLDIMIEPGAEAARVIMRELPRWNEPPGFPPKRLRWRGPRRGICL